MTKAIGIRIPKPLLEKIDKLQVRGRTDVARSLKIKQLLWFAFRMLEKKRDMPQPEPKPDA